MERWQPLLTADDRLGIFDLRLSKIFRMGTDGRYRTSINFDLNNALNANYELAVNNTSGPSWQNPLNIMDARLFKISAQFDF